MPDDTLKLEYAELPLPWHRRRSTRRLIFTIAVATVIGFLTWSWRSIPGDWARYRYWRYRVENHTPMKALPSFSSDPSEVAKMLAAGGEFSAAKMLVTEVDEPSSALYAPATWNERTFGVRYDAITFLHRVTQPSGVDRLVAVGIDASSSDLYFTEITSAGGAVQGGQKIHFIYLDPIVFVLKDGRFRESTIAITGRFGLLMPWNEPFSLFDGVPDPADPSRFTIAYSLRGQTGIIEGRIDNQDNVALRVITGPLVLFGPNSPLLIPPVRSGTHSSDGQ